MGNKKVFYLEFLVKMSKVRFSSKISKEGFNRKMKKKIIWKFFKKSYFRQLYEVKIPHRDKSQVQVN